MKTKHAWTATVYLFFNHNNGTVSADEVLQFEKYGNPTRKRQQLNAKSNVVERSQLGNVGLCLLNADETSILRKLWG